MTKVVMLALPDISIANGQGVYSRKVLSTIANNIHDKSELYLITPTPTKFDIEKIFPDEVKYKFLPRKKDRSILWHFYSQFIFLYYILKLKPDFVIFSAKPSLLSVVISSFFLDFKKIVLVEGLGHKSLKKLGGTVVNYLGGVIFKKLFYKADSIYPAYKSAESWIKSYDNDAPTQVIPCGIDDTLFRPLERQNKESGPKGDFILFGYVGSFRDVHRLDLLLDLVSSCDNYRLKLIGDGEKMAYVKESIIDRGLESSVELVGTLPQDVIAQALVDCDIMWAYTDVKHWGVPIKAYEYLACNKPVIVSKRNEFDFIEEEGFGLCLSSECPPEISNEVGKYLERVGKNHSVESYSYIKNKYNWSNFSTISDRVNNGNESCNE
ncbi:glycosyltransferase [Vibrio splendidus]